MEEGGVRKVNINRMVRDGYVRFVQENAGTIGGTRLQEEEGRGAYARDAGRVMREVLGSAGKL